MGLDVMAYRQIKLQPDVKGDDDGEERGYFRAWKNPDFPGRADEIEHGGWYSHEGCIDAMSCGYGGYSRWRNQLAELAGWPSDDDAYDGIHRFASSAWSAESGPFWELINFADNEGVIGAAVSAKLAKDFADFQRQADELPDDHFRANYALMRHAFEVAAESGCVVFS